MKKILAVLVAIAIVFTMSPAAFAGKRGLIPFWQNGGNVTTLISIMGPRQNSTINAAQSTGATITITLVAADTSSGYTISPTTDKNRATGTTGQTFATARFQNAGYDSVMQVDTAQIGTNWATIVWSTSDAYSATAAKFGYGVVDTGTAGNDEFTGWVAVYGGTNPAGFTVQITDAGDGTLAF